MDALSPARTCDPWAIHSAKTLAEHGGGDVPVNTTQERILAILKEAGEIEYSSLVERLGIKPTDLEREIAALRHMEKVRGKLSKGRKFLVPW